MSVPSRKQQNRQRKREQIKVATEKHKLRLRSIQTCYEAEELAANQDFEEKKCTLHEKLELKINKKMRIVQNDLKEYVMKREMEDITDFLRSERRTIQEVDSSPKPRRKPIVIKGPHIVYRLTDEEIEEDLKIIRKALRERELSPESRAAKERSDEGSSDGDLTKAEEEEEEEGGSDQFYPSPRYPSGGVSPKYTSGEAQDSINVDYFVEYEPSGVVEMIEVPIGETVLEDESWIESETERWRPCCYYRAPDSCYVVKAPYLEPKVELGEGDGSEECREVPQLWQSPEPLPLLVQPRVPLAPSTFPLLSSSLPVQEVSHDEWLCDNVALNVDLVTEGVYESE